MQIDIQQIKARLGIVGNSPALNNAIRIAAQVAPTDMSVLIMGESGVGKENFPKIIHQYSLRKHGPYIAVNCGAIPEGTIDSELFGHLKGSFTGAITDRKGYFQEASGGTIFLDEVGELPLPTQARLLRVLETGEFIPVGASQPLRTDVRIVAATNVNLKEAVTRGRFREDLLYRMNTVPIEIPPLRDRREDVPLLFRLFASINADKYNMPPLRLSDEARSILEQYNWPGNIRELRNLTDRMSVLEEDRILSADRVLSYLSVETASDYHPALRPVAMDGDLYQDIQQLRMAIGHLGQEIERIKNFLGANPYRSGSADPSVLSSFRPLPLPSGNPGVGYSIEEIGPDYHADEPDQPMTLDEVEKQAIIAALKKFGGKRKQAADELQISERTLYRKIKDYGLDL